MTKIHKGFLYCHRISKQKPLLFRDYQIPTLGENNIFCRIFPQDYCFHLRMEASSPRKVVVFFNICENGKVLVNVGDITLFITRRSSFLIWEIGSDAGEFVAFLCFTSLPMESHMS